MKDLGASSGPGSIRSAHEAASHLRPSGDDPSRGFWIVSVVMTKAAGAGELTIANSVSYRGAETEAVALKQALEYSRKVRPDFSIASWTTALVPREHIAAAASDSDGSPKGGDGEAGSVHDSAGPAGHRQDTSAAPQDSAL